jgi:26S proteasome regulatory subunit N1
VQEDSDATIATLKAIDHPIAKTAQILVDVCSFAGTGNVLKVQAMLHHCDEHIDMPTDSKDKGKEKEKEDSPGKEDEEKENEPKKDDMFQSFAVLGIALLSMGEDIGAEMSLRQFNHLVSFIPRIRCLRL